MAVIVSVNGVAIKTPTSFDIEEYDLTKSGRVASGKMTMEIIARKLRFNFAYDILTQADVEKIMAATRTSGGFFPLVYMDGCTQKTAIVYRGAVKRKYFRRGFWKDVNFALIEQ